MKTKTHLNIFISVGVLFALTRLLAADPIITFDGPGAGTVFSPACAPFCGTFAYAVNDPGVIVGFYTDTNIVPHGFLRTPDGNITSFDAPGAGLGFGLNEGTVAYSINNQGTIAGQFQDPKLVFHGFVRYPDGTITTFDAPGAGAGAFQGTLGEGINPAGAIDGFYYDASNVVHGFLRAPDGTFTTFDAPGAGTGAFQGTFPLEKSINPGGEIDGYYIDQNYVLHGFVRARDGTFTSIDPLGSTFTIAGGINPAGAIAGYYYDANSVGHGFLRAPDGSFTIFDAPGADTTPGSGNGTFAFSVNAMGMITGIYIDASNVFHGFLRSPDGAFTKIDVPGAGTGAFQGTRPEFINAAGRITGFYYDTNNVGHGFLRTP